MGASYQYILALLSGIFSFGLLVIEVQFYKEWHTKITKFPTNADDMTV